LAGIAVPAAALHLSWPAPAGYSLRGCPGEWEDDDVPDRLKLLIAESEPPEARDTRRAGTGRSSGESFVDALRDILPTALFHNVRPAEPSGAADAIESYDAVFLAGSPVHAYDDTPRVRANLDFMRAVFRSGVPSFGSCAGLQLAVVAAGGAVRPNPRGHEIGFARRIAPTAEGCRHSLLDGRPSAYDAAAIHSDEVQALPGRDAVALAGNAASAVQAAEVRCDGGTFWGVQYHPELPLDEVAQAVRRQADALLERGLARTPADVEAQAGLIEAMGQEPDRLDLAWRLGLDRETTDRARRQTELRNFIRHLVGPTRSRRGRG